ncbi:MAG: DNA mismatch repair endonuclease MutL [Chloroflexi bacterium]|nr:DNA mismatch repair endonuclease MutL [Chloroflexota bacterium]
MPIKILPPQVASKIAAGEVVERPASVVKELIENAIDATATDIRIEIKNGGRRLIRVSDNGCGIPEDEASLAFTRHATSKISSEEDLTHIQTLGFRGEALASIAAVSHVTMLTCVKNADTGTLLRLEGSELVQKEKRASPPGTIVTVENLFYNTPARLKFLRSEATESSHIIKLVSAYAIAYPELRFTLIDNGKLTLQTSGNGKLYDVLIKVFGLETAQQMLEIRPTESAQDPDLPPQRSDGVCVYGYVGSPSLHRATRDYQLFFVNRRWIQDRSLSHAVEEAYRTILPTGRYPVAILGITMPPADVDVNVHPTKREVRFRDPRGVFATVQRAVRYTVMQQAPVATISGHPAAVLPREWEKHQPPSLHLTGAEPGITRTQMALEVQRTADVEPSPISSAPMLEQLPMLRVLGQVRQTYIIAEGPDGLYLIDQHAAHERVLFEQLQAEYASMTTSAQNLLQPLPIELPPQQRGLLDAMLESLAMFGFDIAPFGGDTYLVRAIPATLNPADVPAVIAELLDMASEGRDATLSAEHLLIIIACHSAVRAGQTLTLDEARELIRQLEKTTAPYTCPHGRPTMIHLSSAQLERSFSRR